LACPGEGRGDISHPQRIRRVGDECAIDQIRRLACAIARRRYDKTATADADETGYAHQARDPLLPDANASNIQISSTARRAIRPVRGRVERADALHQHESLLARCEGARDAQA
jgi:hypothetical protein